VGVMGRCFSNCGQVVHRKHPLKRCQACPKGMFLDNYEAVAPIVEARASLDILKKRSITGSTPILRL
jgi:hypothetical protein